MKPLTTVTIRLCMTIEIPGHRPIQFYKRVPIALGRNLDGTPMKSLFDDPGTQHEGVVEVDLTLTEADETESLCSQLSLGITHVQPNGVLRTVETVEELHSSSQAYIQLGLLREAYK